MRRALITAGVVVAVLAIAYIGVGYVIFDKLSRVTHGGGANADQTPDRYDMGEFFPNFNTSAYLMPEYEDVSFTSRGGDIDLVGWYVPGEPDAPAIILTHGIHGCKCAGNPLLVAGMLHRSGFNVLLFDLRDHGFSEIEDGRTAIGNNEYLDVLGAWDWLQSSKGFTPGQIGLYGESLGAGTALIAFAEEPGIDSLFVDSPYSRLDVIIREELERNDYPTFLAPGGLVASRIFFGTDLLAHSPEEAVLRAAGRPIYIVHGTADERVNVHHTRDLAALAESVGTDVQVWLPEGATHVDAEEMLPDEYEQRLVGFFKAALAD